MKRTDLMLFAALLACAVAVVNTQHHARRLFVDLQRENGVGEQLASDLQRLQADQATLAAANRVERAAVALRMHVPDPASTQAMLAGAPALAGDDAAGSAGGSAAGTDNGQAASSGAGALPAQATSPWRALMSRVARR